MYKCVIHIASFIAVIIFAIVSNSIDVEASDTVRDSHSGYITIEVNTPYNKKGTYKVSQTITSWGDLHDKFSYSVTKQSGTSGLITGSGSNVDTKCDSFCPIHGENAAAGAADGNTCSSRQYIMDCPISLKTYEGYQISIVNTDVMMSGLILQGQADGATLADVGAAGNGMWYALYGDRHDKFTVNYIANTYYVKYNGNGSTSGSMNNSTHTYDVEKALSNNAYGRSYQVSFDANGGTCSTKSLTATYKFDKWTEQSNGSGDSYTNKEKVKNLTSTNRGTVNLYAKWKDGSITLPTPTRTGYTFDGWYTKASGGTKIGTDGAYTPTKIITLYAHWTENSGTIQYNANGGTAKSGYSLTNNIAYENGSAVTKTIKYTTSTVNLTNVGTMFSRTGYHVNDGTAWKIGSTSGPTISQADGVSASSLISALSLSSSTGTTTTLYANWIINQSTLTINPGGGTWGGSTSNTSIKQNYNTTKTIANPTITNYTATFKGNDGTVNSGSTSGSTVTLKTDRAFSSWTKSSTFTAGTLSGTTFTFGSANGGKGTLTASYSGSYNITLPSASRTGYTFLGWYTAASGGSKIDNAGASVTLSTNVTYYAQWKINQSTLTVNPNDGEWTDGNTTYTAEKNFTHEYDYEKTINNPINNAKYIVTFEGDGGTPAVPSMTTSKTFKSWTLTGNAGTLSGKTFTFGPVNGGAGTLTAQWNDNNTIILPDARKENYTFLGWYTKKQNLDGTIPNDSKKEGNVGEGYKVSQDTILYAYWKKKPDEYIVRNLSIEKTYTVLDDTYHVSEATYTESIALEAQDSQAFYTIQTAYDIQNRVLGDTTVGVPGFVASSYTDTNTGGDVTVKQTCPDNTVITDKAVLMNTIYANDHVTKWNTGFVINAGGTQKKTTITDAKLCVTSKDETDCYQNYEVSGDENNRALVLYGGTKKDIETESDSKKSHAYQGSDIYSFVTKSSMNNMVDFEILNNIDYTAPEVNAVHIMQDTLKNHKDELEAEQAYTGALYTNITIYATDYAKSGTILDGDLKDTAGIKQAYLYVFDKYNKNVYKRYTMTESEVYENTTNYNHTVSGKYSITLNLYQEFPDATALIVVPFVEDYAGNISLTDEQSVLLDDWDDDTEEGKPVEETGDSGIREIVDNESEENPIYEINNICAYTEYLNYTDGSTIFQAGEFGICHIWTYGYVNAIGCDYLTVNTEAVSEARKGLIPVTDIMNHKVAAITAEDNYTYQDAIILDNTQIGGYGSIIVRVPPYYPLDGDDGEKQYYYGLAYKQGNNVWQITKVRNQYTIGDNIMNDVHYRTGYRW